MKNKYLHYFILFIIISTPIMSYSAGQGGVLDTVLTRYEGQIGVWETAFYRAGLFIFWTLASISVVMTGAQLIFQRDNISSFFAELIRLILFLGFFLWILSNGISIATAIRDGLMQLAGQASGNGSIITPSGIVDIGFDLFEKIVESSSIWEPIDSATLTVVGLVILLILAVVGINMLLMLVTTYIIIYSGIIMLGFGGGRWTSDMAIGYLKQVLNLSLQLASMILIIGIGQSIIENTVNAIGEPGFSQLAVVLVQASLLVGLVVKIPPLVGSLAGGNGSGGIGSFGVGSVIAAAAMLTGTTAAVGAAMKGLAVEAGGLAKAFQAAKSGLGDSGGDSGGGKMNSAVDALSSNSGDNGSSQDGKPLTATGNNNANDGSNANGRDTGSSNDNFTNSISSGSDSGQESATAQSSNSEGNSSESSQTSINPIDNNGGDFRHPETITSKTTNTGNDSPLAAAMGGNSNKVSNWEASKKVIKGLAQSKVERTINNTAGGRLAQKWKDNEGSSNDV